ncbi:hypothetical protein C8J56DRAFT_1049882 [Mycena floridula]|nr:hypothetical protein C8J56DRAFT_1049882 [Mycena floridula]
MLDIQALHKGLVHTPERGTANMLIQKSTSSNLDNPPEATLIVVATCSKENFNLSRAGNIRSDQYADRLSRAKYTIVLNPPNDSVLADDFSKGMGNLNVYQTKIATSKDHCNFITENNAGLQFTSLVFEARDAEEGNIDAPTDNWQAPPVSQ